MAEGVEVSGGEIEALSKRVPNAHDTTHVVKVVCNYCDHLGYQKVKLGQPIEHECSNSPVMDPMVSVTICAWEYEEAE